MYDYKEDIKNTRVHALGGSDGKLIKQIAEFGYVPKGAYKRLAVCKGLIPQQEIPQTAAVKAGDYIENAIYEHLKESSPCAQSNPLIVSKKYSRKNCALLCHIDIRICDESTKTLTYIEVKASKYETDHVRHEYDGQLYIESLLGKEDAKGLGKGWKFRLFLAHYNTADLDLTEGVEFDPSRLSVRPVRFSQGGRFDVEGAMTCIDEFLETFNEYYDGDEVDANLLPTNVQSQFSEVAQFLREIKEREDKVAAFKTKLYDFLSERGIRKVACDDFSFTVVAPTQQISVDYKALFTQEIEAKKPRVAKQLKEKYKKTTNKKGWVLIHVNNDDKS